MTGKVDLARAAQLLGVRRHEIQKLIRDGRLQTFEGKVELEALRECYPTLGMGESVIEERTRLIRTEAFSRRVQQTVLPDTDSLEAQLRRYQTDLSVERSKAQHYRHLLEQLVGKLQEMQFTCNESQCEVITELNRWLLKRMQ